jgi:hypothetical protein
MTINAISGPAINYGTVISSSGSVMEYNEERGPSLNDLGEGTLDPRYQFSYQPGNRPGVKVMGWPGCFGGPMVDACPTATSTNGIALVFSATQFSTATQTPFNVTIGASTSLNICTISGFVPSSGGSAVTVYGIDLILNASSSAVNNGNTSQNTLTNIPFGPAGTINFWNPTGMVARNVTFYNNSSQDLSTTLCKITGYDVYGFQMTELIPFSTAGATVTQGNKAFKYIQSATVFSTGGAIVSSLCMIGVGDKYGFPIRIDSPAYIGVMWGPSSGQSVAYSTAGNHVLASTVATATSTTGDVRGTWTASAASNATNVSSNTANRLVYTASPTVAALATIGSTQYGNWGLVGYPQA